MATKIRLMRMGKIRTPFYRIVVTDSRKARNGLSIEEIGRYVPGQEPSIIEVNSERALYWLGVGAQASEAVEAILKVTGDWQKFKGLPGTEGTLRFATPKPHKSVAYEAAVKSAMDEPKEGGAQSGGTGIGGAVARLCARGRNGVPSHARRGKCLKRRQQKLLCRRLA